MEKQLAILENKGEQMTRSLEAIPQELKAQKNVFEEVLTRIKEIEDPAIGGRPPRGQSDRQGPGAGICAL